MDIRRGALIPCLVVSVLLTGCDSSEGPPQQATVADSAGITIRSASSGPWSSRVLSAVELFRHGTARGDYPFGRVNLGVFGLDGEVYVYDALAREVVAIGPDDPPKVILTSGSGPAEIGHVFGMVHDRESLFVNDVGNAKILVVRGDTVVKTIPKTRPTELLYEFTLSSVQPDGRFLLHTAGFTRPTMEGWVSGRLARWMPGSQEIDTLAAFDVLYFVPMDAGPRSPFLPSGFSSFAGDHWTLARSDRPELKRLSPDGQIQESWRWPQEVEEGAEERFNRYRERLPDLVRAGNPGMSEDRLDAAVQDRLDRYAIDDAKTLPLFDGVTATSSGHVWIGEYAYPDPPSRYAVISPDGDWVGHVELSTPTLLLDADGELLLGVAESAMGEPEVVVYQVDGITGR